MIPVPQKIAESPFRVERSIHDSVVVPPTALQITPIGTCRLSAKLSQRSDMLLAEKPDNDSAEVTPWAYTPELVAINRVAHRFDQLDGIRRIAC